MQAVQDDGRGSFGRLAQENVQAQKVCLATVHLQSYYRVVSRVGNV